MRHDAIPEDDEHYEVKSINYRRPVKSELRVDPSEDNNIVTLTHTVSFYRRQQSQVSILLYLIIVVCAVFYTEWGSVESNAHKTNKYTK